MLTQNPTRWVAKSDLVAKPPAAALRVRSSLLAWALPTLVLVGFALRLVLLTTFPLREDEAIYSYWALHFWRQDPWFLTVWPDKPPLFIWLLALAQQLWGPSPAGARLVSIMASTLLVPVTALLTRRLAGETAGIIAALLLALNPFAISFGPTVYTDTLLVLFGMLSLSLVARRRTVWAGIWLGAAIMTKQQGLLYAPLVLGVWWLTNQKTTHRQDTKAQIDAKSVLVSWSPGDGIFGKAQGWLDAWLRPAVDGRRAPLTSLAALTLGIAVIVLPVLYWDSLRWQVAPSPWDLGARHYAALSLAPPFTWSARLAAWDPLLWHLCASWLVWGGLALITVVWAWRGRRWQAISGAQWAKSPDSCISLIILWMLAFAASHIVTTVQPWDRYLLPLAPLLALVVAHLLADIGRLLPVRMMAGIAAVGALLLVPPALAAARGALPIGGDHGDYRGLDEAIAWVKAADQGAAILYHRVLGWHFQYYFFDEVARGANQLRWYSSAVYLADNAAKTPFPRKYVIEPDWAATRDLKFHLQTRRLELVERSHVGHFTVYEIVTPPQPLCSWCQSRVPLATWQRFTAAQPLGSCR